MKQLKDYADRRLIRGCIYCGGQAETRDHVPSRILLDPPYPENLPVVGACRSCNNGFSKDEEYVVCLLESIFAGSTDPSVIRRPSVARALRRSPALRTRIEASKQSSGGEVWFQVDETRIETVILKLARGHAAFELSQIRRRPPDVFRCTPIFTMPPHEREMFEAPQPIELFGEIGSRAFQRAVVAEVIVSDLEGNAVSKQGFLMYDWIDVQEGMYSYLAADEPEGITIKLLIANYLACEICWLGNH